MIYGVDLAKKQGDRSVVVHGKPDGKGDFKIVAIDEFSNLPDYKWYRNPIKWWQWRRLMRHIGKSLAKGKKDGTIWTSWND